MNGTGPKSLNENSEKETLYTEEEVEKLVRQIIEKKARYKNATTTTDPEINELLRKLSSWMIALKRENQKRISWLECTLEDKIPEYKEWIDKNIINETEQLEQKRKIA